MIETEKRALALLNLTAAVYMASMAAMLVYPQFIMADGGRNTFVGLFVSVVLLPFLFLSPKIGHAASRIAPSKLMTSGAVLVAFSCVGMLFVNPSDPKVLALRLLQGIGHVFVMSPLFASAMRLARQTKKTAAIGNLTVSLQLGGAGGLLLSSAVAGGNDVHRLLIYAAITAVVAATFAACLSVPAVEPQALGGQAATRNMFEVSGKADVLFLALAVCSGACVQLMSSYVHDASELIASPSSMDAGYFLTANFIGSAMGRLLIGRISFSSKQSRRLTAFMAIGVGAMPILITLAEGNILLAVAGLSAGILYGVLMPALTVEAVTAATPSDQGRVSGKMVMFSEIGFRGGPLILASIADRFGYSSMYYFVALLTILAAAYYFLEPNVRAISDEI
jgi:predicted MFS family arabinose efflux permease